MKDYKIRFKSSVPPMVPLTPEDKDLIEQCFEGSEDGEQLVLSHKRLPVDLWMRVTTNTNNDLVISAVDEFGRVYHRKVLPTDNLIQFE